MTNQIYEAFGPHLVLGGSGAPIERVSDPEVVRQFLVGMPDEIGMTPISPVMVMPHKDGVSGFVIIAESHIVVHTKVDGGHVHLDIFSCKDFDTEKAAALFWDSFGPFLNTEFQLLDRGLEFPRDLPAASNFVQWERGEIFPQ